VTITCSKCGHQLQGKALFCPNCGYKIEEPYVLPIEAARVGEANSAPAAQQPEQEPRRQGCGLSLAVLGIALAVVLVIVGIAATAVYLGMADRAKVERQAAQEHYIKGEVYAGEGQWELAIAEFELTLQLDPGHKMAPAKLADTRRQLGAQPTATPMYQQEAKEAILAEMRVAHQGRDWQRVMTQADKLLALDPSYRRDDVDQMLYDAFYQLALLLVEENRLTEAVTFFDRALLLQPSSAQVSHAKELATLYMNAMRYWGADWDRAIEQLNKLYQLNPNYLDVRERVIVAYTSYGDVLAQRGDGCRAEEMYVVALQFRSDPGTLAKSQQAAIACRQATPTSEPAAQGTPGAPDVSPPAGTYVGKVERVQDAASSQMFLRGQVLDAAGKGVPGVRVKIQAWDWSALALSDGAGQYSFDGLANPVTYTLSLPDVTATPVDALGQWGKITWVVFRQAK
jgi:tetratricopeptide (TPR) repeat protein